MKQLDFNELMDDYIIQENNLGKYIPFSYLNFLTQIGLSHDEYFFDIDAISKIYNMVSDEGKDPFLKVIYSGLVQRYDRLIYDSKVKSTIYQDGDIYNIRAYFEDNSPLLAFELKYDEKSDNKKIECVFYDDLMENEKIIGLSRKKARINEELHNNDKRIRNIPMMDIMIGGGSSLYVEKSRCDYELRCEYEKIYNSNEFSKFLMRKRLLEIYFNTFECYIDYYNIDRKSIEDGNKITIKKYPYMDLSVVFTNKKDIKELDNESKTLVKK